MLNEKRVGILGGTFDPIHLGHLIIGENAYSQCNLENVLVMPSGKPPHKDSSDISNEIDRSTMVKLSIAGNNHFSYSGFELERNGYIYTSDTLQLMTKEHPDTKYFFILGEDSIDYIEKWHEPEIIMQLCTIVVAHRNNGSDKVLDDKINHLRNVYNADIIKIKVPRIEISSTDIRNRVNNGSSIKYLVVSEVENYIYKNNLYKEVHH